MMVTTDKNRSECCFLKKEDEFFESTDGKKSFNVRRKKDGMNFILTKLDNGEYSLDIIEETEGQHHYSERFSRETLKYLQHTINRYFEELEGCKR